MPCKKKVVVDAALRSKLDNLANQIELCDESGETLGYFLPPDRYREFVYAWAMAQFSDENNEDLEAARREPGGMTTPEVLSYLEKLIRSRRNGV